MKNRWPWIPREYHQEISRAAYEPTTDCWAFGTLLWEMFSYGQRPLEAYTGTQIRKVSG